MLVIFPIDFCMSWLKDLNFTLMTFRKKPTSGAKRISPIESSKLYKTLKKVVRLSSNRP